MISHEKVFLILIVLILFLFQGIANKLMNNDGEKEDINRLKMKLSIKNNFYNFSNKTLITEVDIHEKPVTSYENKQGSPPNNKINPNLIQNIEELGVESINERIAKYKKDI